MNACIYISLLFSVSLLVALLSLLLLLLILILYLHIWHWHWTCSYVANIQVNYDIYTTMTMMYQPEFAKLKCYFGLVAWDQCTP